MVTSPNLKIHLIGPKMLVFIQKKTYFKVVLTGKALKHCMFELRLQIGLGPKSKEKKKDFHFNSDFI